MGTETDIPNLFVVETPLGFTVRVTEHYWRAIVAKHPDLAGRQEEIQATLREPEEVRRSRRDHGVPHRRDQGRRPNMAQVKVFYEPERELLTVFWQEPREHQLCTELDDGVILIKDEKSGEPIGLELLSYRPGDARFDSVNVELGSAR